MRLLCLFFLLALPFSLPLSTSRFHRLHSQAIPATRDLLHLISSRYQYDTPLGRAFLLMQSSLAKDHYDHLKFSLARKFISGKSDETYVMVFGGSSVTAGHDNAFHDSYPQVVDRQLAPILAAAGVTLDVRNIAQGANPCLPSDMCYDAMGGVESADFYSWEQGMNCGRSLEYPEYIMRLSARNGAFYYHAVSSGATVSRCEKSMRSPPFSSPDFFPNELGNESRTQHAMRNDLQMWKNDMFAMNKMGGGSGGVDIPPSLFSKYAHFTGIGGYFKVHKEFPTSVCEGLGLNNVSCKVADIYGSCRLEFLTKEAGRYGSSSGGGANWHPSRALHLFRGELILWQYAMAILDALLMITADSRLLKGENSMTVINEYGKRMKLGWSVKSTGDPPTPTYCGKPPMHCHIHAKCFTSFAPHYAKTLTLEELIVSSPLVSSWKYVDQNVSNAQHDRSSNQLERRPRLFTMGGSNGAEAFLRISVKPIIPSVLLCWGAWTPIKSYFYELVEFRIDLNVSSGKNAAYVPGNKRIMWPHVAQPNVPKNCAFLQNIPPGNHILGLESKNNNAAVGVTHVIMFDDRPN